MFSAEEVCLVMGSHREQSMQIYALIVRHVVRCRAKMRARRRARRRAMRRGGRLKLRNRRCGLIEKIDDRDCGQIT